MVQIQLGLYQLLEGQRPDPVHQRLHRLLRVLLAVPTEYICIEFSKIPSSRPSVIQIITPTGISIAFESDLKTNTVSQFEIFR